MPGNIWPLCVWPDKARSAPAAGQLFQLAGLMVYDENRLFGVQPGQKLRRGKPALPQLFLALRVLPAHKVKGVFHQHALVLQKLHPCILKKRTVGLVLGGRVFRRERKASQKLFAHIMVAPAGIHAKAAANAPQQGGYLLGLIHGGIFVVQITSPASTTTSGCVSLTVSTTRRTCAAPTL